MFQSDILTLIKKIQKKGIYIMEENAKELKEKLFNKKELGWNSINDREKEAIYTFSNGYMNFLNKAKIEREFVISAKERNIYYGTKCKRIKRKII